MTYPRVVLRNGLQGSYSGTPGADDWRRMIAGDLRRLEADMLDDHHIQKFRDATGATEGEVREILKAFFTDFGIAIVPWLGADPHGRDLVEAATATVCNRKEAHDPHVLSVANVCLGLRLAPMPAKDPE
jgi:hypothetical protein